jgi:hypothetical protein
MKKLIFLLPLLSLLSACQPPMTRTEQLAIYRSRCLDYGYQLGTRELADCMKEQEARDDELSVKERKVRALEERNQIERERIRAEERKSTSKNKPLKIDW